MCCLQLYSNGLNCSAAGEAYNITWIIPDQGPLAPFGCMEAAALVMNNMLKTRPFWQCPASQVAAATSHVPVSPNGKVTPDAATPTIWLSPHGQRPQRVLGRTFRWGFQLVEPLLCGL